MRTPIRYAGGKSKAYDFISSYIPFWPRPKRIISPFIGGGSLEVRWAHEMGIEIESPGFYYEKICLNRLKELVPLFLKNPPGYNKWLGTPETTELLRT